MLFISLMRGPIFRRTRVIQIINRVHVEADIIWQESNAQYKTG